MASATSLDSQISATPEGHALHLPDLAPATPVGIGDHGIEVAEHGSCRIHASLPWLSHRRRFCNPTRGWLPAPLRRYPMACMCGRPIRRLQRLNRTVGLLHVCCSQAPCELPPPRHGQAAWRRQRGHDDPDSVVAEPMEAVVAGSVGVKRRRSRRRPGRRRSWSSPSTPAVYLLLPPLLVAPTSD